MVRREAALGGFLKRLLAPLSKWRDMEGFFEDRTIFPREGEQEFVFCRATPLEGKNDVSVDLSCEVPPLDLVCYDTEDDQSNDDGQAQGRER